MIGPDAVRRTLDRLADRRPVFHSEADFQHALAWTIATDRPDAAIRLERPVRLPDGTRIAVDVWVRDADGTVTVIELKYPTRRLDTTHAGERFRLPNHAATDLRRYDLLADLYRTERACRADVDRGAVVMLTNEPTYWRTTGRTGRIDEAFRIPDGVTVSGTLGWADHAAPGSIHGREDPIPLTGRYDVAWRDYADVADDGGRFRSLVLWAQPG